MLDDSRFDFVAEQAPKYIIVDWQRIHCEYWIAGLLELLEYFVIDSRVIMVGPAKHYDSKAIFCLELVQDLASGPSERDVHEGIERLITLLHGQVVLFRSQPENVLEGVIELLFKQARFIHVQDRVQVLQPHLREEVAFLYESRLDCLGCSCPSRTGPARLNIDQIRSQGINHREENHIQRFLLVMHMKEIMNMRDADLGRETRIYRASLGSLLV